MQAIKRWESQVRKGMLDYVILLYLQNEEHYGYEMIRTIKSVAGIDISEGTIYPLLNRLKREELIASRWVEMETGLPRKYYLITDKGRQVLEEMRSSWTHFLSALEKLEGEQP